MSRGSSAKPEKGKRCQERPTDQLYFADNTHKYLNQLWTKIYILQISLYMLFFLEINTERRGKEISEAWHGGMVRKEEQIPESRQG